MYSVPCRCCGMLNVITIISVVLLVYLYYKTNNVMLNSNSEMGLITKINKDNAQTNHQLKISSKTTIQSHLDGETEISKQNRSIVNCTTGEHLLSYKFEGVTEPLSLVKFNSYHKESDEHRNNSFNTIFQKKSWGTNPKEGMLASGPGSTLYQAMKAIHSLNQTLDFVKKITGKSTVTMLDLPCGDMTWMPTLLQSRNDVHYTGMDIVEDLITKHRTKYAGQEGREFIHADSLKNDTTIGSYDVIFSRMMMQHLYHFDIMKLLIKLSSSGSQFLLMTTFVDFINVEVHGNLNQDRFRFRPLNLQHKPFQLTPPICINSDTVQKSVAHSPYLGLWKLPLTSVNNCDSITPLTLKPPYNSKFLGCGISQAE